MENQQYCGLTEAEFKGRIIELGLQSRILRNSVVIQNAASRIFRLVKRILIQGYCWGILPQRIVDRAFDYFTLKNL